MPALDSPDSNPSPSSRGKKESRVRKIPDSLLHYKLRSWSGVRDCELISRRERDVIQTLFSIYFFSVCSKPKKDGDISWIS